MHHVQLQSAETMATFVDLEHRWEQAPGTDYCNVNARKRSVT